MTYNKVYGKTEDVVSTSDKYTTYESLGYTKSAVIDSMSAYNRYCQQHLIRLGAGEHVLTMVIQNADLLKKIYSAAENGSYIDDYAQAVVNALSLKNCDISLKMRGETLTDGYILLTQTVIITSEPIVPTATPMPTAKPTPTSTAIPTIVPTVIPTSPPTVEPTITPDPGVFTPSIQDGIPTPAIS